MRAQEFESSKRTVATKQAMVTRRLYAKERDVIEKIWDMRRRRSLKALQAALDLLWDYYAKKVGTRRSKPQLRLGPGTAYHGRNLSYTMNTYPGQVIELAPTEQNFYVLVHELTHALGPDQHGRRFAAIYRDLLSHDTFKQIMSSQQGQEFLRYLEQDHPQFVRKAYRNR